MLTLGELIQALERKESDLTVRFDFVYFYPQNLHSYRGDYSQVALGYANTGTPPTVKELLDMLNKNIGQIFMGYKGGEYTVTREKIVFVGQKDEAGRTVITDVTDWDGEIILKTGKA